MSLICNRIWNTNNAQYHYYIFPEKDIDINFLSVKALASFYLIFNGLIPLDLAVAFVMVKLIYIFRLTADAAMFDVEKSAEAGEIKGCKVKNLEIL